MDSAFHIVLILSTFMCSLVAGFLFAFAVVVMPGIKNLTDRDFIRAFRVIDRVIQNNQPIFIMVWIGSVIALLLSVFLGVGQLDGVGILVLIVTLLTYLIGVQIPTITVNVPLNNKLQLVDLETADRTELRRARTKFEHRWNRWNMVRTICASLTTLILTFLLFWL